MSHKKPNYTEPVTAGGVVLAVLFGHLYFAAAFFMFLAVNPDRSEGLTGIFSIPAWLAVIAALAALAAGGYVTYLVVTRYKPALMSVLAYLLLATPVILTMVALKIWYLKRLGWLI